MHMVFKLLVNKCCIINYFVMKFTMHTELLKESSTLP